METTDMNNTRVVKISDSDFENEVLRSNIPVLVDFYADWCGPCKIIAPTMDKLSEEYAGKIKFVKINVDDNQELASKYDIMSIPTAMLFKGGNVEDSMIGAFPAGTYKQHLERVLA